MPNHFPIEGGKSTHKPEGWDEATQGPCDTLSVLYRVVDGLPTMTSAWRFGPAELSTLAAAGGTMFLSIHGTRHPVISVWVQDASGAYVPADAPAESEPAQDVARFASVDEGARLIAGLDAFYDELEEQAEGAPELGDIDGAGQVWLSGTFNLKAALEAAFEAAMPAGANGLVELPVLTLNGLAAEARVAARLAIVRDAAAAACDDTGSNVHPLKKPVGDEHKTGAGVAEGFTGNSPCATPASDGEGEEPAEGAEE